jgi:hypothetical protein
MISEILPWRNPGGWLAAIVIVILLGAIGGLDTSF